FLACVREQRDPKVGGHEAASALEVAIRITEAIRDQILAREGTIEEAGHEG
ncbi:MAG: hypothetical protein GVY10_04365, partial [Verrucomicrobia bacterium]|nr:hypothetical protein [Verrucomicrobiota bacterium]